MERNIQFIQTTPDQLTEQILKGVNERLEEFQKSLQQKPSTQWLTRDEAAKLLSVSLVTLHDWTKRKILISYRIGNKVRYKKDEVENSLKRT